MNSHRLKKYELKIGDSGRPVAILKELLYAHGEIPRAVPSTQRSYQRPTITDEFDETMSAAVAHFQKTEGLPVTGIADLKTWAVLGEVISEHKTNFHTNHNPELRAVLAGAALKPAWPSKVGYWIHQESIRRVLSSSLSARDLERLQFAVQDADRSEWQTVEFSARHAMTPAGASQEDARRVANQFVRDEITTGSRLYDRGDHANGMLHLGYGMHCLQDSTSPAHANFREYQGGNIELLAHMNEELFDPGAGSRLDEATKRAYMYFKGTLAMPNNFFTDLGHDVSVRPPRRRRRIWR